MGRDRLTHNIPLNLQLPAHKQLLRIRLALDQFLKLAIVQYQRDVCLFSLGRHAPTHGSCFLEVDVPGLFGAVVLQCEPEDPVAGFYGGFAVGGRGGEGGLDCVKGGGRGEGV